MTAGDDGVRDALLGQPGQLMADDRGPGARESRPSAWGGRRCTGAAASPGRRPGPRPAWDVDVMRGHLRVIGYRTLCGAGTARGSAGRRRRRWRRRCRRPGGRRPGRGARHRTWRPRHGRGHGRWTTQCLASEGRSVGRLLEVGQGDARVLLLEFGEEPVAQDLLRGAAAGAGGGRSGGGGEHLRLGGRRCPRDAGDREGPGEHEDDGEDEGESSADAAGCGVHGRDRSEE